MGPNTHRRNFAREYMASSILQVALISRKTTVMLKEPSKQPGSCWKDQQIHTCHCCLIGQPLYPSVGYRQRSYWWEDYSGITFPKQSRLLHHNGHIWKTSELQTASWNRNRNRTTIHVTVQNHSLTFPMILSLGYNIWHSVTRTNYHSCGHPKIIPGDHPNRSDPTKLSSSDSEPQYAVKR